MQDVQAMYNPEFIIKTDDDVYIRQAVQKTRVSLSMSSSLYINTLLFYLECRCSRAIGSGHLIRSAASPMLPCYLSSMLDPSQQLPRIVVACKPLQFEQWRHSMCSIPITACTAPPITARAASPSHPNGACSSSSQLPLAGLLQHILYDTVRYSTVWNDPTKLPRQRLWQLNSEELSCPD